MKKLFLPLISICLLGSYVKADNYCDTIRYGELYASDGTYLGILTNNPYDSESIANSFGKYGSEFQTKSIFNEFGTYGSEFNTKSPRNEFATATSVPRIYKGNGYRYLSLNEFIPSSLNTFDVVTCFISPFDERLKPFKDLDNNRLLYIQEKSCQSQFGTYSTVGDDRGKCKCKNGYKRDKSGTSCIPMTEDEKCAFEFGNYAYSPEPGYCNCIAGYEWNRNKTSCKKSSTNYNNTTYYPTNNTTTVTTVDCSVYGPKAIATIDNQCTCEDTFEWNYNKNWCVAARNNSLYNGTDFRGAENGGDYINMLLDYEDYMSCLNKGMNPINNCKAYNGAKCVCKECENGYELSSDNTSCIKKSTSTINSTSNTTNSTSNTTYNKYSQEYNDAYEFAFANKITTMPSIDEANMYGQIIRAEIAKMLANWVKSLGYSPDTSKSCNFNDISSVQGDLYTAIIESCQLGIMGQGITAFRPYDKITRAEVGTAISRILRGSKNDGGNPYYANHLNALVEAGILTNIIGAETYNEVRGNVMTMLMKASNQIHTEE